jgi:hypothetical protein
MHIYLYICIYAYVHKYNLHICNYPLTYAYLYKYVCLYARLSFKGLVHGLGFRTWSSRATSSAFEEPDRLFKLLVNALTSGIPMSENLFSSFLPCAGFRVYG